MAPLWSASLLPTANRRYALRRVSASASPDLTATVTVDLTAAISSDADYEPNLEEIIISAEGGEGYAPSASQFIARMQECAV